MIKLTQLTHKKQLTGVGEFVGLGVGALVGALVGLGVGLCNRCSSCMSIPIT
jgi:hypothetical protein